jgi:hypothetical protein
LEGGRLVGLFVKLCRRVYSSYELEQRGAEIPTEAERFFDYCISIAKELEARLSRKRVFVQHNLSSGTANEAILRDFLSNHAQSNVNVAQGFICNPFESDAVSRQ